METRLQQVFQTLRWCGATMIIAAAGTFLVQGWDQVDDVTRYLALLGTTVLLPALAYVCGIHWQEGRSARVLMITLLALIPIHAGVLGGFVFSQFGDTTTAIASVAQWVAPSPPAAVLLVLGAAVTLIPLMWASFRVLERPHATWLTAASAGTHALLLFPDRSPLAGALTLIPVLAIATWMALRVRPQTLECRLAVATIAAPAVLIAARQVLFYDVSNVFWGTILMASACALFAIGRQSKGLVAEPLSIVPMLVGVAAFVDPIGEWAGFHLSSYWLLFGAASAVPLLVFAWRSSRSSAVFIRSVVALNATTTTLSLLTNPGPWAALQAIAFGLGLLSYGWVTRRRPALYAGIALAAFGFIIEVVHAIEVFQPSGWLALAGFGFALVALTAWLERRARAAKLSLPVEEPLPQ